MRALLALVAVLFSVGADAWANEYRWRVTRVVDGDTLSIVIPELPEELRELSVRVRNVDTPEKAPRAKCRKEASRAREATEFTRGLVAASKNITFTRVDWDKFGGRIDADVWLDGRDLAQILINAVRPVLRRQGPEEGMVLT
jgi:micrococcal nuclease